MGLGLRVSRRGVLGLVGRLGLEVGGAVALGGVVASGRPPKAVAADQVTDSDDAQVVTERRPHSYPVEVRYATDLVFGPRGDTMQWGLERFSQWAPHIRVVLQRGGDRTVVSPTNLTLYQLSDSTPHVSLLSQAQFLRLRQEPRYPDTSPFADIRVALAKRDDYYFIQEKLYFVPDSCTLDNLDHSFPQPSVPESWPGLPRSGLPFELAISGFMANASLAEGNGVRLPDGEDSWTWDDWTEWDARITDPETPTFGTWARDDYAGQYMPQMYTNGLKKPFDDGLTKTMFDQPEALEAWTYLVDKVFERKTSPTFGQTKELAGEHGNPFAAGKIGIWPTNQVGSTGYEAPRIKDRFTWTLLPEVLTPGGGPPGHSWSMKSNLVTASAELDGTIEEAVSFAVFLAGPEFQVRVGVERGYVPVYKPTLKETTSLVEPPEGMKWLKVYADRPDNRSPYPFEGWETWWRHHKGLAWKGWFGTQSAEEALVACQDWGERFFSFYDGPKPFVREPVYP